MDTHEIKSELSMSYAELVDHLLDKYGPAKYDYFCNSTCRSKNRKVSRTKEGLICHHIDEDKAIMLSDTGWALMNPYEYQRADRLVYCNLLEHLILHYKITQESLEKASAIGVGFGGAINFIIPQINDYYGGRKPAQEYQRRIVAVLDGNYDGYIAILQKFMYLGVSFPCMWRNLSIEELSKNSDGKVVDKVFASLDEQPVVQS
jgi:hypothetical protein